MKKSGVLHSSSLLSGALPTALGASLVKLFSIQINFAIYNLALNDIHLQYEGDCE